MFPKADLEYNSSGKERREGKREKEKGRKGERRKKEKTRKVYFPSRKNRMPSFIHCASLLLTNPKVSLLK